MCNNNNNNNNNNHSNNNLEALISKISYKIAEKISENKKLKNLIDKSLGVLSHNGVYAYYVYIISQDSKEAPKLFLDELEDIFNLIDSNIKYSHSNREQYFQEISQDLYKLLFLKELLEKTLIYVKYHTKAMENSK